MFDAKLYSFVQERDGGAFLHWWTVKLGQTHAAKAYRW
jgi:hypothetical protein